jgi:hypothetical protein
MDNIVRLSTADLGTLLNRLNSLEDDAYPSMRVMTGRDRFGRTFVKYDIGAGWTPAIYNVDEQYDRPVQHVEIGV